MFKSLYVLLCLGLVLSMAAVAFGQGERTTVTGTVSDDSGAIVVGASLTIRDRATNIQTKTTTNSAGLYFITSLPPGTYDLTAEKRGFEISTIANIPLTVGLAATINVTLHVGSVTQSVVVTADAVQLESQTSALQSTITTRSIAELPNSARSPLAYAALVPNVVPTTGQQALGNAVIGSATTAQMGGGLAQQNGYLVDGVESRGTNENGAAYSVPLEAVSEVRVDTTTYSAEFGRALGGITQVASKSGTDQFHGTGWEFLQNADANANSWQNDRNSVAKAPFQQNRYGANIGGPIKRNKTFFFFNYEALRQGGPAQVLGTVPTDAVKAGNFSQQLDAKGEVDMVYDPLTTYASSTTSSGYARLPFPNDTIPASRFNNIAANVLKYYPEPNRPGQGSADLNNFFMSGKSILNTDNYLARVDHYINPKNRIYGRYGYTPYKSYANLPGSAANPTAPGFAYAAQSVSSDPGTAAMISVLTTFTPTLLGEARLSYTRLQGNVYPVAQHFNVASLGFGTNVTNYIGYGQFPAISVDTYATGGGLAVTGAPSTDFDSLGGATRTYTPMDTWNLNYHFTWIKTRHNLKFGTDDALMRSFLYNSQYSAGQYIFDRTYTQGPDPLNTTLNGGNGLASLELGLPVSGTLTITNPLYLWQKAYALYVQDDYRVTNRLTLNLGLRWEYITPYAEKFGQIGDFYPNLINPDTGLPGQFKEIKPGGYVENPQRKHFEPRVGLAFRLNDKTVVRAAASIVYADFVGVNAAATDLGNGGFISNLLTLGAPNPLPNTPPVGGSWNNPFAGGIVTPGPNTDWTGTALRADVLNRPSPYMTSYSASVQRLLSPTLLLEVGFTGSEVTHLYWNRQNDANDPLEMSMGSKLLASVPNPFYGKITSGALSFPTITERQLLLPYPQYQAVLIYRQPYAHMDYDAGTLRLQKQMSHGVLLSVAYTKEKTIASTMQSNTWVVGPSDSLYNPNYNRSIEANDVPQRFVASYIYDLPFGKGQPFLNHGIASAVLGNWELSGIAVLQRGTPLMITAPDETNLINFISTAGRANRVGSCGLPSGTKQTDNLWFNTASFQTAAPFTLPTDSVSEPNCRGPGMVNFNTSLIKNILYRERYKLQLRFETFNTFNHPLLQASGTNTTIVNSPQFGQIVTGGNPRNLQFGARLLF
jgi:outer membrane receptor protein involved in Fe transport